MNVKRQTAAPVAGYQKGICAANLIILKYKTEFIIYKINTIILLNIKHFTP